MNANKNADKLWTTVGFETKEIFGNSWIGFFPKVSMNNRISKCAICALALHHSQNLMKPFQYILVIHHICHIFYTGRIFEYQIFTPKNYVKHPKITTITPHKCKICSSSHSIWKILHRTEFFYTGAARGARDKYEVWDCLKSKEIQGDAQMHLGPELIECAPEVSHGM